MKKTRDIGDQIYYKQCCARNKRIIKNAKEMYWKKFCDSLNYNTKVGKVWREIKKISGKIDKQRSI